MRASRSSRVGSKYKGHSKSVSVVHGSSDLDMAGAFEEPPSRDARPLKVKHDACSSLLARVRGSPNPRVMRVSRTSRVGGEDKGHSK
eukprot:3156813-Pleurochrysis_carterae.AAC.1